MNQNLKKMISYYKPYRAVFAADMLFATLSAAVALTIPLVVRYVTSTLIYQQPQMMLRKLFLIGIGLFVLLALDCYSRFFIGNYGHVMGAKMEYDMRAELFGHLQKLSFSFYDDAKVGQLMSRVTADLFDGHDFHIEHERSNKSCCHRAVEHKSCNAVTAENGFFVILIFKADIDIEYH